ncbi:MAG: hypothetical protein LBU12_01190 [Deltaproteobacteria bacterium]|jgi:electron transfer flavoprotein alpha/beta subunit|nr:hypothetical protein [Deltaproteobacteria bacterium]
MRILALFKVVAELEALTEEDWRVDAELRPQERYVRTTLNPEDESALELALRLREALPPGEAVLTALTIGDERADRTAATLMALKFDRVVRLAPPADLRFRPELTAALAAAEILARPQDLILTGCRSADGGNALTPFFLAERLGWPIVAETLSLAPASAPEAAEGGEETGETAKAAETAGPSGGASAWPGGGLPPLAVESLTDDGLLRQVVVPPLLAAVGNAPSAYLRVPTVKDRLSFGRRPPEVRQAAKGLDVRPRLKLRSLTRPDERRRVRLVDQGAPSDKAAILLQALTERRP